MGRDYFAFFKFYYYLFKKSPKKYDMVNLFNDNQLIVVMTGFIFFIISMIIYLVTGIMFTTHLFGILMVLSAVFLFINLFIAQHVYNEGRRIELELEKQKREARHAERLRKHEEEMARLEAEMERLRQERMRRARESFERQWRQQQEDAYERARRQQHERTQNSTTDRLRGSYAILGIEPTRDPVVIRKAYRSMAKKHHPDMGGDQNKFIALKQAYDLLMKAVEVTARKV